MSSHGELFHRLLDESAARLAAPESAGIVIPDDELHREIIVPLLPAMLGDKSVRQHWTEQAATGFPARLARHFENGEPAPRWLPGDFEIHVTASYSAGADARALADTLLSEDSLRDMAAALMNELLDVLWPSLAPAPAEAEPVVAPPVQISDEILQPTHEPRAEAETPFVQPPPSRALVRALCRKLAGSAVHLGLVVGGTHAASAAILARRILARAAGRAVWHKQRARSMRGMSRVG